MYHPTRGGVRGGRDQFNWDDVKGDKHRENYLGHSIKAPVGRWQKGKDLHWYAKDRQSDEAAALEEIKRLKEEEDEAMQEMLGLAPKKHRRQNQLDAREMSEVLKKVKDGVESAPSYADGERVQGLGFVGQASPRQPGAPETGAEKSAAVTFEKVSLVIHAQVKQKSSGDEGNIDARKDDLDLVEAKGITRLEGQNQPSSSSSEEERNSSKKRKRGKRREEKRQKYKCEKSKAIEREREELPDSIHGDASDGRRKVRDASEDVETSRGHRERKASGHKNQSRNFHTSKERYDSEGSQGSLQANRKTSARDCVSRHSRTGTARHDSDSEDGQGNLRETVRRTSRRDYALHLSRNLKFRHDSGDKESQERLQDRSRASREKYRTQHSRNGSRRHDSE